MTGRLARVVMGFRSNAPGEEIAPSWFTSLRIGSQRLLAFRGKIFITFQRPVEINSAMAKSPQEMKAAMIAGLAVKTGKSLPEWLEILRGSGLSKHKELVALLKTTYGLTHGFANMIALQALNTDSHTESNTDLLVDGQYAGAKASLRPVYDAILAAVNRFGTEVEIAPKKSYVSLRRNKQFAIIQPSTNTRVDVGINLKDTDPEGRLEAAGSFNAMLSHRVRVSKVAEVDAELMNWLKRAYEAA